MEKVLLQGRDLRILAGLFESRVMTLRHAATLYFDGREQAAKKRLQAIRHAGYIAARREGPGQSQVFFLSRRAHRALSDRRLLPEHLAVGFKGFEKRSQVSAATIRHELDVMTVKAALVPAVSRRLDVSAVEFWTWPRLFAFRATRPITVDGFTRSRSAWMKPDGFLRVTNGDGLGDTFYVEVDRGTETQQTLASKAAGYRDHLQHGAFAHGFGGDPSQPGPRTFRVLMVFQTKERRNNAAASMLALTPPVRTLTWLTTMPELTADPLGPIWIRPKDYLTATAGTEFAPDHHWHGNSYVRRTNREDHIESTVTRHRLFAEFLTQ